MSPPNKWVQLANQLPWPKLEAVYTTVFPSKVGRARKPFRLFFGAQLIKQATNLSDVELVNAIRDTPAYQYFIGLPKYQIELPFSPSAMTVFRKRIAPISPELRTIIGDWAKQELKHSSTDDQTIIVDATVVPVNIRFPQDYSLLNQDAQRLKSSLLSWLTS